jgi:Fe-S-cluster containining protein
VILEVKDVERFTEAGRGELARRPWTKRKDGKVILVLQRNKRCKHLLDDNRCNVYSIRPDACSTFPMGSECCLFAREDEMGFKEGLFAQQAKTPRPSGRKVRAEA